MNLYDYPQFLDATFQDETKPEADFIEQACGRYALRPVRQLLEPGCGGGRLIVELARRGFALTGFDTSRPALQYLERRLARSRLRAELFSADMANFRLPHAVDAAYCTYNTFRHLLTEELALSHLRSVARCLRRGGIYVLGLHLLPLDVDESCIERWSGTRGRSRISVTLRVLSANRRARLEHLRLSLLVHHARGGITRVRTEFPLRMYTARQFRRLLEAVPEFELCDVFDFWYEIDQPLQLNDDITDTVVVLRKVR